MTTFLSGKNIRTENSRLERLGSFSKLHKNQSYASGCFIVSNMFLTCQSQHMDKNSLLFCTKSSEKITPAI